jgi:hypothetical protein
MQTKTYKIKTNAHPNEKTEITRQRRNCANKEESIKKRSNQRSKGIGICKY